MANLIAPLGYRLRHAHEVYLLEGIGAQCRYGHLSGNHHDGCRVHHGIGNSCQRVGHSRATGNECHPHFATHSGITFGSMGSTLLMSHQHMVEAFLLSSRIVEERIIHGHDGSARVSEDGLHPLSLQRPHQRLRSCYSIFQHRHSIVNYQLSINQ